jgi:TolB-like protein/Flp pilus assembly protein TadD
VVLFVLLSGGSPYDLDGASRQTLERAILATEPAAPSHRRRAWARDLDNIVLKALKKSAVERYPSAGEFAADIRRYLRREPVIAQPDTPAYRFKKLAHRHRSALKGAAVAAIAIFTGLAAVALNRGWPTPDRVATTIVPRTAPIDPKSVAVLPFVDLSEQKDQGYLSDGLSEELIGRLANIAELRVPASASSFYFKGRQTSIAEIGTALRVANVLEGSVRRAGDQVRITVQLIDATTGFHRWSQSYQRDFKDVLQVQSDVAGAIAQALQVSLTGQEIAQIGTGGTLNPEAYESDLRAEQRLASSLDKKADAGAALALFDHAIALDPNYALAYTGRARALATLAVFHSDSKEREGVRQQALAAAQRGVALAPELGETHVALAITLAYGLLDFQDAGPEFDRALELAPGSARVQRLFAEYSSAIGHHAQAIAAAQRAVSLNPQDVGSHMTLGRAFHNARRFNEALLAFHDAEALRPKSSWIEGNIAGTMIAAGHLEAARQRCESDSLGLSEQNRDYCLALVYHRLGRQTDAENALGQLRAKAGDEEALAYAEIYSAWGDTSKALAWLLTADKQRDPGFQSIRVNYLLDPLREFPEFRAIEAHMRFPL